MTLREHAMMPDDAAKLTLGEGLANDVGARFLQGHQVVRSGREIELRGRWNELPVRLRFGPSKDTSWR